MRATRYQEVNGASGASSLATQGQFIGRKISSPRSDPHNHRPSYPLLLADHGAGDRIMVATMPSMRSVLLPLAGFRLPAGPGRRRRWQPSSGFTGFPSSASLLKTISFSSSLVGIAVERKQLSPASPILAPRQRYQSRVDVPDPRPSEQHGLAQRCRHSVHRGGRAYLRSDP